MLDERRLLIQNVDQSVERNVDQLNIEWNIEQIPECEVEMGKE
jgi:hypothetical protein